MELIQAIALLCQIHSADMFVSESKKQHLQCQQSYLHCVLKRRSTMTETDALQKCILEK